MPTFGKHKFGDVVRGRGLKVAYGPLNSLNFFRKVEKIHK